MRTPTKILLSLLGLSLLAAAPAATTAPGLPWVTATRQAKIRTNPASGAATDASLLLDASSAGSNECMIGVDTATDVCIVDKEGDAAAASMAVVGTSSAATLAASTAVTVEETGAGTDVITIQAPASIAAAYALTLPIDDGAASQVLTTDGAGALSWTTPGGSGDITAIGSVTSGDAFLSTGTCDEQWHGCGASAGRIKYDSDPTPDVISVLDANLGVGIEAASVDERLVVQAATTVVASLRASGGGAVRSILQLIDSAGANGWDFGYDIDLSSNNFTIRSLVSTTPSTRLVIDEATGNVGFGSDATPDTMVDVQGTFSAGTNGEMSVDTSGNTTCIDLAVNGGDLTTTASTFNLLPSVATAINIGTTSSADINIGDSSSTVDFGDTASAATSFLPDANLGADLGSSSLNFSASYIGASFVGFVHDTGDGNYTIPATVQYVVKDDPSSGTNYAILPSASSSAGRRIEIRQGDSTAGVMRLCTPQEASCGGTGSDTINTSTGTSVTSLALGTTGTTCVSDGSTTWWCK